MTLRNVMIITFGFQTVINLTRPIITLYALHMGSTAFDIGILTASYSLLPLIFAIQAGKIADKVGDRLPILLGSLGITIGMLIPFMFASMWSLYVSQFIVGLANVFLVVSLQNVLGNTASKENRDYYFSMFGMAVAAGALLGPLLGGYISEHLSYTTAFLVSIFISFIPIAFSFYIPVVIREKQQKKSTILSSIGLLNISILRKALFSSALVLYSKDIFIAYFPLFAKQNHISEFIIGWIISIQALAMIIVRFILPKLTNFLGRDRILSISIIVAGVSFILLPFTENVIILGLLSCLMGFGLGCGQPLSMTITYNASPKNRTGEVLGLRLSTNRLSQMIAPVFFGLVGSWVGVISVFFISGAFLLGGTLFVKSGKDKPKASNHLNHS
ncbi:MFS transporter [Neobacillus vireti]|uniref:MFS family transporter n=1 Tax=Neobacillus vireti LMG 21834 TaxID=1131730 RepID=A0AB94ISJ8_9BACI|nr:MFS transporter [Neobacillus vireti]ETI69948.1 MFS family transporter [Neobacillus vireti LMG 21834]KLT18014.1 MFS transporter [Neobacillus vireti]